MITSTDSFSEMVKLNKAQLRCRLLIVILAKYNYPELFKRV